MSVGTMIAESGRISLGYAEKLLADVTSDRFARFASVAGKTVVSNHPAFILGHLGMYSARVVELLGGDASDITPPESFGELFSMGAECQDDAEGAIYPSMSEITERFLAGYRKALDAVTAASDEVLAQVNTGPMAERLTTIGAFVAFLLGPHIMMHNGQLSAWRRMEGLGPA